MRYAWITKMRRKRGKRSHRTWCATCSPRPGALITRLRAPGAHTGVHLYAARLRHNWTAWTALFLADDAPPPTLPTVSRKNNINNCAGARRRAAEGKEKRSAGFKLVARGLGFDQDCWESDGGFPLPNDSSSDPDESKGSENKGTTKAPPVKVSRVALKQRAWRRRRRSRRRRVDRSRPYTILIPTRGSAGAHTRCRVLR
ncbi:hypothetical protein EI94DRAFT_1832770 [Lactarius quietus]|nr:hypothetical protein EI94DRAFT_1832770 [Lactarius quietus]